MQQIYKVFINNKEINFSTEQPNLDCSDALFIDKSIFDDFFNILEKYSTDSKYNSLNIFGDIPERLFLKFASFFRIIEAAGGIVKNSNNDILFIYRNNMWDLPKGKIDNGETPEMAAIREVKEECGLKTIHINRFIAHTYHIYINRYDFVLKKNWWYELLANESQQLTPQLEEGIQEVKWICRNDMINVLPYTYNSLQYLLENYLKIKS
ncbi:MAG: NUDIX domain-containing protein [Bacteroidetes bacterium]|nr:NUDIX domain-containing protein [Bacteroidota bacterium]